MLHRIHKHDRRVAVFHGKRFTLMLVLPVPSQCWKMIENKNTCWCCSKEIQCATSAEHWQLLRTHHFVHARPTTQIAKFMGPTWGPPGSCRPQMGPMLAPWTLLLGYPLPGMMHGRWALSMGVTQHRRWDGHRTSDCVTGQIVLTLWRSPAIVIATPAFWKQYGGL